MSGAGETRDHTPSDSIGGDPESATRLGIVAARPGVRAWAFAIDVLIWSLLAVPAGIGAAFLLGGDVSWGPIVLVIAGSVLPALFGLVQLVLHGRRGVTAGKAAMRLRSVSVVDLGRPGFWRIVLRALVLCASGIVPVVGPAVMFASGLWDREGRGRSILDRVAGCWLIDARAGLDPADARALRRTIRELEMPLREVSEGLPSLASNGSGEPPMLAERRSRAGVVGVSGGPWAPHSVEDEAAGLITAAPRIEHVLVFEDGSSVRVPEYGLIGRQPEAAPGQTAEVLLALEDPDKLLSKTHLAFGLDAGGVWVMDRNSSNGTTIVGADGAETPLTPGSRVGLEAGVVVRLGGRMFQVRRGGPQA